MRPAQPRLLASFIAGAPREQCTPPSGRVWVATPATTVLDLVDDPDRSGGLSNAATVIAERADDNRLSDDALADAAQHFRSPPSAASAGCSTPSTWPPTGGLERLASDTAERRSPPWTGVGRRRAPPTTGGVTVNTQIDPDL